MKQLIDNYGRKHDYLRISVTDRCNLRCIYCMGPEGVESMPHKNILSYEEILQVVQCGAEMGISKIRLTGGEPLVRKNITYLVREIASIPGINDLSMTTNGILFSRHARELHDAGLHRINISLDTLDSDSYYHITRGGDLQQVMDGIDAALELGMEPLKLNVVLMKGLNHHEVPNFLDLAYRRNVNIRFIEYMPIGEHDKEYDSRYLPLDYIKKTALKEGYKLADKGNPRGAGPAQYFSLYGGKGSIGLIHSISKHFCSSCNRLRLTADGRLKSCLYWQEEANVRPALETPEKLRALMQDVITRKPKEHMMGTENDDGCVDRAAMRNMSRTGG